MRGVGLLAVLVGLSGCASGNLDEALDLTSGVADGIAEIHADDDSGAFAVLRLESRRPYTGFERRGEEKEKLPLHLRVDDAVTLSLAGGPSDAGLAARIEASTGLRRDIRRTAAGRGGCFGGYGVGRVALARRRDLDRTARRTARYLVFGVGLRMGL